MSGGMVNVGKNLGQIASNKWNSLLQNPDSLKQQSLILASLILVVSRILVANVSAVKARGTKEGPYRYRESIRTNMREIGGWTLGFMMLRQFQAGIKSVLAKKLNVTEVGTPVQYSIWDGLKKAFNGREVTDFAKDLDLTNVGKPNFDAAKLPKWFSGLPGIKGTIAKNERAFIEKLYKVAPIALGSIPAVILSGYALERITRDHSDKVVDFVSKKLKGETAPKQPEVAEVAKGNEQAPVTVQQAPQTQTPFSVVSQPPLQQATVGVGANALASNPPITNLPNAPVQSVPSGTPQFAGYYPGFRMQRPQMSAFRI